MATFQELVRDFEIHAGTDGEMDNMQLATWFNEAQMDLSFSLGPVVKYTFAGDADEYDLPADCLTVIDSDAEFRLTPDNKLQFVYGGPHAIYYRKSVTPFTGTDMDAVSELHPAIHNLLPLFAASRYWDQESEGDTEESNHGSKWMSYYQQGKANALRTLTGAVPKIEKWTVI